jgi:hypothetical protein
MSNTPDPSNISDLLAVATVRRMLLEMGLVLQPETSGGLIGPLGLWVMQPRVDLGGLTPLEVLKTPNGEADLKACLSVMAASIERPGPRKD